MHRRPALLLAAVAALGAAACSDEDREDVSDVVETAVGEAEDAGRSAITEVSLAVEDAEDAGRSAITDVSAAAEDALDDAVETLARNIATEQGEEQFSDAGHPLDDEGLTCEATAADGAEAVDISCTGTTEDGGAAELTGTTSEVPGASAVELEGSFTGTVDGAEVFTADALGG